MSGKILWVAVLLGVSTLAGAQIPGFQLGVKAGTNLGKIDGQSFKDEFNFGYHLGAFSVIKLSKTFQLQPEVLFNQYNTKTSNDFEKEVTDPRNLKGVSLQYLSIPLILNISPSKLLAFQLGPQYGILINRDNNLVANGKNAFKEGDFSVLGGLQLNLGSWKVNGRYIIGLNDISDLAAKRNWKNQAFQLSVGYRLL